jgi:hypothetical protein
MLGVPNLDLINRLRTRAAISNQASDYNVKIRARK